MDHWHSENWNLVLLILNLVFFLLNTVFSDIKKINFSHSFYVALDKSRNESVLIAASKPYKHMESGTIDSMWSVDK